MKQLEKTIMLSAEQLKHQGDILTNAMAGISVLHSYANALSLTVNNEPDSAVLLSCLMEFVNVIYDQTDILYKELDNVAYKLLECDNENATM